MVGVNGRGLALVLVGGKPTGPEKKRAEKTDGSCEQDADHGEGIPEVVEHGN